jgi:chromosome segregation ATPase
MHNSDLIKKIAAKKKQESLDTFLLMCTNPNLDVPDSFKKAAKDTLNEMNRIDEAMKKLKQEERNTNRFLNNLIQNDHDFFENITKLKQQLDALNAKDKSAGAQTQQQGLKAEPPTQPMPMRSAHRAFNSQP